MQIKYCIFKIHFLFERIIFHCIYNLIVSYVYYVPKEERIYASIRTEWKNVKKYKKLFQIWFTRIWILSV